MNCHCNQPAVIRKVVKPESVSFGKDFFSCNLNACKFFQLVGGALPYSATSGSSRFNKTTGPTSSRKGLISLKISLCSYDVRLNTFWFSVQR